MKSALITSVLVLGIASSISAKTPLETFDIPENERNMTVTYCPPHGRFPQGVMYASQLLELTETDEPDYDVFTKKKPFYCEVTKFNALLDEQDDCDRVGVLFVAKFIAHFWPGTPAYNELEAAATNNYERDHAEKAAKDFLWDNPGENPRPFIQKARIEARRMVAERYPQK